MTKRCIYVLASCLKLGETKLRELQLGARTSFGVSLSAERNLRDEAIDVFAALWPMTGDLKTEKCGKDRSASIAFFERASHYLMNY